MRLTLTPTLTLTLALPVPLTLTPTLTLTLTPTLTLTLTLTLKVGRMRATPDFQPRYASPVSLVATAEYIALATKYGIKPLELAFAWARDRWYNAGVIPGFTTVAQVEACVEAFKLEPLPAALNEEVDAIHERYRNPCATYANKELVQTAPWLEDAMRPKEEL